MYFSQRLCNSLLRVCGACRGLHRGERSISASGSIWVRLCFASAIARRRSPRRGAETKLSVLNRFCRAAPTRKKLPIRTIACDAKNKNDARRASNDALVAVAWACHCPLALPLPGRKGACVARKEAVRVTGRRPSNNTACSAWCFV